MSKCYAVIHFILPLCPAYCLTAIIATVHLIVSKYEKKMQMYILNNLFPLFTSGEAKTRISAQSQEFSTASGKYKYSISMIQMYAIVCISHSDTSLQY